MTDSITAAASLIGGGRVGLIYSKVETYALVVNQTKIVFIGRGDYKSLNKQHPHLPRLAEASLYPLSEILVFLKIWIF